MDVLTRRWLGGSSYELTISGLDRWPLPGEAIEVADMGRVRVMSARDIGGDWRLVVQDGEIGPQYDELPVKPRRGAKTAP